MDATTLISGPLLLKNETPKCANVLCAEESKTRIVPEHSTTNPT